MVLVRVGRREGHTVSALGRQARGRGQRRVPGRERRRQVLNVPRDDVGNGPDPDGRAAPAPRPAGLPEEGRVEDDLLPRLWPRAGSHRHRLVRVPLLDHLVEGHPPGQRGRRGRPSGTPSGQAADGGLPLHPGGRAVGAGGGVRAIMRMPHYDHVGITIHDGHGCGGGRGVCGCGRRTSPQWGRLPRTQGRRRRRSTRPPRSIFPFPLQILLTIGGEIAPLAFFLAQMRLFFLVATLHRKSCTDTASLFTFCPLQVL